MFAIVNAGQSTFYVQLYPADSFGEPITVYSGGYKDTDPNETGGVTYSNFAELMEAGKDALRKHELAPRVIGVTGIAPGAFAGMVDENEHVLGGRIQSNVTPWKPETQAILDDEIMPLKKRFERYGTFDIGSLAVAGQLLAWGVENPELLREAKRIRFLDQLLIGPWVENYQGRANEPAVAASSAGCHGGLLGLGHPDAMMQFSDMAMRINDYVERTTGVKLIGEDALVRPRIYTPRDRDVFFPIDAKYTGLRDSTIALPFMHDTTEEQGPVDTFLRGQGIVKPDLTYVYSPWATWFMTRVVLGEGQRPEALDSRLLGKGVLSQTNPYGVEVTTGLEPAGEEHGLFGKEAKETYGYSNVDPDSGLFTGLDYGKVRDCVDQLIHERKVFVISGRAPRAGFATAFPGAIPRIIDPDGQLKGNPEMAYAASMFMALAGVLQTRGNLNRTSEPYYISGGAAGEEGPAEVFSSAIDNKVYRIRDENGEVLDQTGELGAWTRLRAHFDGVLPEQVDLKPLNLSTERIDKPFTAGDVRAYFDQWAEYARQTEAEIDRDPAQKITVMK